MVNLDWFFKKSGKVFNLQETNFPVAIWGKEDDEELVPLYSIDK